MARGWESKAIEDQQAAAAASSRKSGRSISPEEAARLRRIEGLRLSRRNIERQLAAARSDRHRSMLQQALDELDLKIRREEKSE